MKKRKFKITLTPAENSIVIQSLNHLRNTMLRENRDTGCLDGRAGNDTAGGPSRLGQAWPYCDPAGTGQKENDEGA